MTHSEFTALRDLSGAAFKVWFYFQQQPTPRTSLSELEAATGLARSSVRRAIDELLQHGYISRAPHCPKCGDLREAKTCTRCGCCAPPDYHYSTGEHSDSERQTGRETTAQKGIHNIPYPTYAEKEHSQEQNRHSPTYAAHVPRYAQNAPNPTPYNSVTDRISTESLITAPSAKAQQLERWKKENVDYARHSSRTLNDAASIGYHIRVWSLARRNHCTDDVFNILRQCEQQRHQTGKPQGKAFTVLTKRLFEQRGLIEPRNANPADVANVRAALSNAPFMQTIA